MEMHGTSKVKKIVLHIQLCTSTYTYRVFDMYLGHLSLAYSDWHKTNKA